MKKVITTILAAFICLGLTACGGFISETTEAVKETDMAAEEETEDEDSPRVCIVYAGRLGDKSCNDSCNAGAQRAAADFGVELKSLEGSTEEEWEANVLAACEGGYDLIIGASSGIADYIAAYGPDYPDTKFAAIDTTVDLPNVQSVFFAQNEGFFLAGAAAAMFTEKTEIEGVNEDAVIGWAGGMDIPILNDLFAGFKQGAEYINPDIRILQSFAGGWNDPAKGKELALAQFDQGADIVMNAASGTGAGVFEGAGEKGLYAIGAGLNQDADRPGAVLTSVVNRVDNACYLIIQSVAEGTFQGGTTRYLSLEDGGVSLTDFSVIKEYLGDKFPQDIVDTCSELAEMIISGEIIVETGEGLGPAV